IPGNDDAIRSIKLITSRMADAVIEGLARREARRAARVSEEREKPEEFTEVPAKEGAAEGAAEGGPEVVIKRRATDAPGTDEAGTPDQEAEAEASPEKSPDQSDR
ncbi:MAG: uS2 family ribosomal protein, partial [Proteobacteria bacterium]|nr:uS2 family ribosomal protein [Pseudomonadota bacterium]